MSAERQIILNAVMKVLDDGENLDRITPGFLLNYANNDNVNPSLLKREITGIIENVIFLDYIIDTQSRTPTVKMKPAVRGILRMAVYEMYFMDAIKDYAAVNEAVKLAKKRGFSGLSGFVNGVLRAIIRVKEDPKNAKEIEALPAKIRYSVPDAIYDIWVKEYGEDKALRFAEAQHKRCGMTLRLCGTNDEQKNTIRRLEDRGIRIKKLVLDNIFGNHVSGYLAEGIESIANDEDFIKGRFYIQDISSIAAAAAASPKLNDNVIDVCAAPGGKALYVAELLGGTGHVEARDITQDRVRLIEENIRRLGLENISARVFDATAQDETLREKADIVIADLPCSGLGVLRRKPDIKYSFNLDAVEKLARLQADILDTVCTYVKPGGRLIFSTCTMTRKENEENADGFLARHPDFTEVGRRRILPDETECNDGFFISVFNKHQGA